MGVSSVRDDYGERGISVLEHGSQPLHPSVDPDDSFTVGVDFVGVNPCQVHQ